MFYTYEPLFAAIKWGDRQSEWRDNKLPLQRVYEAMHHPHLQIRVRHIFP